MRSSPHGNRAPEAYFLSGPLWPFSTLSCLLFVLCRRFELERPGVGPCSRGANLGKGGDPLLCLHRLLLFVGLGELSDAIFNNSSS